MAGYLLIASREPFEPAEIRTGYGLFRELDQARAW
jgi:hypothetical protein